ncbi:MAG: nuclear transport factor 2 family protein [Armatimonadota bacterium]
MNATKIWLSRVVLPIITIYVLAYALFIVNPVYAKGVIKSGESKSERSSDTEKQKVDNSNKNSNSERKDQTPAPRSQPQPEQRYQPVPRSQPQSEPRYQPTPRSQSQPAPRSQNQPVPRKGNVYTPPSNNQWRDNTRDNTRDNSRDNKSEYSQGKKPNSTNSDRQDNQRQNNYQKPDNSYQRDKERSDSPKASYRKDYDDIGQIWKQRRERRDNVSRDRDRDHDRDRINVNININPFRYKHYCYDYTPSYSYPSIYCYYYDYFPPYVYSSRIFYHEPFRYNYRYIEIPVFMNYPDNYYFSDPAKRALKIALRDIQSAWEENDADRIMSYIRPESSIAVFMRGDYSYSIDWQDFYDMTRDAMSSIRTRSFEFDHVSRRQKTGDIVAYAKHIFEDWDGNRETVYVSYTFERVSGDWYISEVGTSTFKNW